MAIGPLQAEAILAVAKAFPAVIAFRDSLEPSPSYVGVHAVADLNACLERLLRPLLEEAGARYEGDAVAHVLRTLDASGALDVGPWDSAD